ncbi:MAG: phage tail protein [Planctomycetes bacterium]|nr:phage tail protein [Planctomycetota bacterium]
MPTDNQAQPGVVADPYRNYNFRIEIQGVEQGHFAECHGLAARVRPIRYREGGMPGAVRMIPGQVEYSEVTLRYGLTDSPELWNWFQLCVDGRVERRNVTIVVLSPDAATDAVRWDLERCWPCEWRGAPLDGLGNEVAIESVTLVYERLARG